MRTIRVSSILLFAFGVALQPVIAKAQPTFQPPNTLSAENASSEGQEDTVAARQLKATVADLLLHDKYDEIDRLADKIRRDKTRLIGGGWMLPHLYLGLEFSNGVTPEEHIAKLKAWVAARPQSITARVALARAYISYAWLARGSGYANTVTEERWQRFKERIAEAQHVLDDSANMSPMCPEWFLEMQKVALAQGWDASRTATLFDQARRFEPDYIYFYKSYANYLLPKWDGKPGDAAAFAKESADAVGGPKGDYLYFHIGMVSNGQTGFSQLDWVRLQSGYQAQIGLYGVTNFDTNQLALFAWRFQDRTVAKQVFDQIGDKWSKEVWRTRASFEKARVWAEGSTDSTTAALH